MAPVDTEAVDEEDDEATALHSGRILGDDPDRG
jgi:hypothetical protein